MRETIQPIAGDWEVIQVMQEEPQEALYRVRHRRNGDLRMLRVLPLDGEAAMRLKFQVESQVAAEMGGAVPVEPFEVSISEDRAFVLLQDTGTLDGLQFGWEEEALLSTDTLRPYLKERSGETLVVPSGTLRVSTAAAAEGPFLAAVTEQLGMRSWMVDSFASHPVAVDVDFPDGCTEDDLVALCDGETGLKVRLGATDEVLRNTVSRDGVESFVALALYPSGVVRGLSGRFQLGDDLIFTVDDPISLIDPDAELELPAKGGLRASLRMVVLTFRRPATGGPA